MWKRTQILLFSNILSTATALCMEVETLTVAPAGARLTKPVRSKAEVLKEQTYHKRGTNRPQPRPIASSWDNRNGDFSMERTRRQLGTVNATRLQAKEARVTWQAQGVCATRVMWPLPFSGYFVSRPQACSDETPLHEICAVTFPGAPASGEAAKPGLH